jgi:hypothetical protein
MAAEMILVEAEPLDLRSHGAVQNEDAVARGGNERAGDFIASMGRDGLVRRRFHGIFLVQVLVDICISRYLYISWIV